jgi:amino-acid N-acetyltransferase
MKELTENSFRLRKAGRADRAAINRLIAGEHLNPMGIDWQRFLLAVDLDGRIAGCAQVKPHGDGTRELASLVVLPSYRGQGLARRLIETLQTEAQPPLYLTCRSSLVSLYQRFGFRLVEDEELTPYFRRLKGLVSFLQRVARFSEGLAVMLWEGS